MNFALPCPPKGNTPLGPCQWRVSFRPRRRKMSQHVAVCSKRHPKRLQRGASQKLPAAPVHRLRLRPLQAKIEMITALLLGRADAIVYACARTCSDPCHTSPQKDLCRLPALPCTFHPEDKRPRTFFPSFCASHCGELFAMPYTKALAKPPDSPASAKTKLEVGAAASLNLPTNGWKDQGSSVEQSTPTP